MTPETRAARGRITKQVARWSATTLEGSSLGTYQSAARFVADLRAVLAALDQQPDQIIVTDAVPTEAEADDLKQRFLAAQHDGTPIRVLGDDSADAERCPSCGQRRDAYRAARREQHPEGGH